MKLDPIKFTYTQGKYREFNGYQFMYGKPTPITDAATIKALDEHPDFARYVPPAPPAPPSRPLIRLRQRMAP